jgi:hypothetical protein
MNLLILFGLILLIRSKDIQLDDAKRGRQYINNDY